MSYTVGVCCLQEVQAQIAALTGDTAMTALVTWVHISRRGNIPVHTVRLTNEYGESIAKIMIASGRFIHLRLLCKPSLCIKIYCTCIGFFEYHYASK